MSASDGVDKGVRILSLDGGGPGTYSQLLIIKEYMVRLATDLGIDEEDVYPADYFDLMGGVGFGGLVTILLGHLRMNVEEAIDTLQDVALAIFPNIDRPIFDSETRTRQLSESLKGILQTRGLPPDQKMQDKSRESVGCKVALYAATAANLSHPIVLRNYKSRTPGLNPTIVDAICATMAIPSYFSPIHIGPRGRQQIFIGGPRGANNATRELLREATSLFGKDRLVSQIVSLGCGQSRVYSMERNVEGVSRPIEEMAVDCEAVAKELARRICDTGAYLRLNVDRGMENLFMNKWDDLGPIETHTGAYVAMVEISDSIEDSLRRLEGGPGIVALGEISHPRTVKDVHERLDKQEELERTSRTVKDHDDSRILDRLNPVNAPSYYENRICMKGTRQLILDQIVTWAGLPLEKSKNNPPDGSTPKNIFWLYGSPGLGKTSVANSLCHRLHGTGSLGGSFFCRRDDPVLCDPNRVLPTLIYRLSWMWTPYREAVVQALRGDPNLNPDWTGCALLLEHLYSLQNPPKTGFVLVVDALDESGDPLTRAPLLKCFSDICDRVDWLKIVVTSRPEHDIHNFFLKLSLAGHDLSKDDQAHQDIRNFARYRMDLLSSRYHLLRDWPEESRLEEIARRSGGLFIFVETLYQLLSDPDPEPILSQVLGGTLGEANAELHKLYSSAIETRIGRNKDQFRLFVQAVVAVATYRPLPDKTLASLIGVQPRVISSWVDSLSSLLYRDGSENGGIRARHLSVVEFLTGPVCPPEFRVDVQQANAQLGRRCLITMAYELRFNICELETSCVLNADIQDLDSRVQKKISDTLQYSSMHWSSHLCSGSAPVRVEALALLGRFLMGAHFLYWLEVLSLMGRVPVAIRALHLLQATFKKIEDCHQSAVEDALCFMLAFFTPISTSAPHIYISGLAFLPVDSGLRQCSGLRFSNLLNVCEGHMKSWPAPSEGWQGHTGYLRCIAYSPDGRSIISGSHDKTIRIWDAQTGAIVGEPLRGHTHWVCSVAYSPNGHSVISGSYDKTIRIWNAQAGEAVGEPFRGHTGAVSSIAYSPDGRSIISGSYDNTIRIWDANTGVIVREPLTGHTGGIHSVACSPDGQNFISGSQDTTVRIWNAQTGEAVGEPLRGHTSWVLNVAYSPDSQNVISGSADNTIRVWDAQTGAAIVGPLRGHSSWVRSVAYSPDGRNIVSGSDDHLVRVWDAETGAALGEPLRGHTSWVLSAAYSPNGQSVISGSYDTTIRIWNAQTGEAVGEPLRGHTGAVSSVAYSPDGQNFISGSHDDTIRIWNAQSREAVRGPLRGHARIVRSVAYSPDGRRIISGSGDGTIRIWDTKTGAVVGMPLKGHTREISSVACSPDSQNIVSGSIDSTIRLWDAHTGAAVGEPLRGHTGKILSVAYSPDSQNVISGSADNTIRVWDAQTGAVVVGPLKGHSDWVCSVAYSPNGQNVISGSYDNTIRTWSAQTGEEVGEPLRGHTDAVRCVTYSPDGRNIVSCSADMTIRIWDAQTGATVWEPLRVHTGTGHDDSVTPSVSSDLPTLHPLNALSGLSIPSGMLDPNGWVRGPEGLLFWVPEDCRNGLTCPAIMTIPNTGRQRRVRIDFSRFQYGTSCTNVRGRNAGNKS